MGTSPNEERKRIFLSELHQLEKEEYITEQQFDEIIRAHQLYYADLLVKEADARKIVKTTKKPVMVITPKVKPEKKKLTAEELRERNISWSLNLGVILLLIGGLFVATSTWQTLENWSKSALIGIVSLLFYGISYLSKRVLKIEKTGFAFIVLGSLFLPIFFLSIGWFQLIGEYLSLTGEGKYVFGLISFALLVPIYVFHAKKLESRLFVWFAYVSLSVGEAFLLASMKLDQDWFYLGLMIINLLTVGLFHQMKKKEPLKLFTKEMVLFAQIQLVLTSLMMMIFFEDPLINGFNVLLSAAIYLSMVYVSGRKEYHFIFSAMIVYGAYQLIEHSIFDLFGPALYVLVSMGFLLLPRFLDDQFAWKRVFQLTSAFVSGLVFLAISFESLVIQMNQPSIALLLAYFLLGFQFLYLANSLDSKRLFTYLSPVFFLASFYEMALLLDEQFHFKRFILAIFSIGFIQFLLFGWKFKHRYMDRITKSSRDISQVTMFYAVLHSAWYSHWVEIGIMLLVISFVLYTSLHHEDRALYKRFAPWLISIFTGVAFLSIGEEWRTQSLFYEKHFGITMNAIMASIAAYIASIGWRRLGEPRLSGISYLVGFVFASLSILLALQTQINELWVRPFVLLAGVTIYLHYYFKQKFKWLPYACGFLTLVWYFTVNHSISIQVDLPLELRSLEFITGGALMLGVCYTVRNKVAAISNAYAWVAHVYLPLALLFTFFVYNETSFWSFLVGMVLYGSSTVLVNAEWKIKTFLYSTFTSLFLVVLTGLWKFAHGIDSPYAYMITSGLLIGYWFIAHSNYKHRTMYYLVPFSIIGITSFIMSYPYTLTLLIMTLLYSAMLLVMLHVQKWQLVTIFPLAAMFIAIMQYMQLASIADIRKWCLIAGIGVSLIVTGRTLYQQLFVVNEQRSIAMFDSYTFVGFMFLIACYWFQPTVLVGNLLPGVILTAAIWIQKTRVPNTWSNWVKVLAGVYLLEPYYSFMYDLTLPALWRREVLVLPAVLLVIFLQRCLGDHYRKLTNQVQWAILVLISISLIQDGLESSTIYDALILGTLSLVSMLAGMFFRIKSYFFVGAGVLLINVFLQTRPFWGNMPWWAYLLIAGSLLISVASYNEWHKQKVSKGEATLLTVLQQKIINRFRQWK